MGKNASIEGAAVTNVGKVREHNEDAYVVDVGRGIFAVCDGMGGHAAGEVASALATTAIANGWGSKRMQRAIDAWLERATPATRKSLIDGVKTTVDDAHEAIVSAAAADSEKKGMGTTVVGAIVVGSDVVFAYSGDSRGYLVREGVATQLTEDHTLLQRMLAAGIDVDVSYDGSRWNSVLTNALGMGQSCKAAVFVVPIAAGDRLLLCSDGVTGYVQAEEIAEVLTAQPVPARAAGCLVDLALARGGGDNATAVVVRIVDAGDHARSPAALDHDRDAIGTCPLWGPKVSLQEQLRALRMALPQTCAAGQAVPVEALDDRVAWIVLEGKVEQYGRVCGPGTLLYPEVLLADKPLPSDDELWVARSQVRALALRAGDFRDVCEEDTDLGEKLIASLTAQIAATSKLAAAEQGAGDPRSHARGSVPPVDRPVGSLRESAIDAALASALAKLSLDEMSDPDISIEPWLEGQSDGSVKAIDREPSAPIETPRGGPPRRKNRP